MSWDIWRPLTGNSDTSRSLTFTPSRAELMSRMGAEATTVTVSWTPAGLSSKSSVSSRPTASGMAVYSIGAKPGRSTEIV